MASAPGACSCTSNLGPDNALRTAFETPSPASSARFRKRGGRRAWRGIFGNCDPKERKSKKHDGCASHACLWPIQIKIANEGAARGKSRRHPTPKLPADAPAPNIRLPPLVAEDDRLDRALADKRRGGLGAGGGRSQRGWRGRKAPPILTAPPPPHHAAGAPSEAAPRIGLAGGSASSYREGSSAASMPAADQSDFGHSLGKGFASSYELY